ncbi:MAG TPA: flagellar hook protein [Lachnospiraceae bacterium]|nr:flagellar hook protein [Lachnospiraceae bacterium]
MVVQHNLTAMNSNRMLGLTTKTQAKSTEKLSSGYKINRAADDAAGLSISEKMRKQIRGLTQASLNAQDGISAVQTAEGALNEVQDMLQRMNELAVKSSNGTNSEDDREYIQNEIDQLTTEIDRVSTTTKFNETYLLQGNAVGKVGAAATLSNVGGVNGLDLVAAKGAELKAGTVVLGKVGAEVAANPTNATAALDEDKLSKDLLDALNRSADGTIAVAKEADKEIWTIGGNGAYTADDLKEMGLNVTAAKADAATVTVQKKFTATDAKELQTGLSITGADAVDADAVKSINVGSTIKATVKTTDATGENVSTINVYENNYVPDALKFSLQVGADANADNKIKVEVDSMSAAGLGLLNADGRLLVNGKDSANADSAIKTIASAIQRVSTQRSALGAVQNRLEHTINNLDNVVENTTSAESQIRDTDMATEMVKYSNNNILSQAGQAMLAQSNQSNQGVLSLLQ